MSSGSYFVIGAIKGGNKYKKILEYLARSQGNNSPHCLYIGAAALNKVDYKIRFEKGFMNLFPGGHVSSLNLSGDASLYSGHGHPAKIEKSFSQADIIYFDGGGIAPLKEVFDRFSLRAVCQSAFDRGAAVGGLCGGGSVLAEQVVHYDKYANEFLREDGIGLLQGRAVSCHVDLEGQFVPRVAHLRDAVQRGHVEKAIALGSNQVAFFDKDGDYTVSLQKSPMENNPFYIDQSGQSTSLPVRSLG